eukprot:78231-Hanusia_phi.AAC.1
MADIFLDNHHVNAHTTASEVLPYPLPPPPPIQLLFPGPLIVSCPSLTASSRSSLRPSGLAFLW